jgi:hypothetical protein
MWTVPYGDMVLLLGGGGGGGAPKPEPGKR